MDNSINAMPDKDMATKICITCHKELPLTGFGKRRYRSSKPDAHWIYARYGECRTCANKRKARWRSLNPNYMKEWYTIHKQDEQK